MLLYSFCFVLFWIWGQFPSTSPRGLIFGGGGGDLTGVSCVTSMGDLYLEGLIRGGAYFRNFAVCLISNNNPHELCTCNKIFGSCTATTWNFLIGRFLKDLKLEHHKRPFSVSFSHSYTATVKPLLSGHLRNLPKCPLNRGCMLYKGCKTCAMFVNYQHSTVNSVLW